MKKSFPIPSRSNRPTNNWRSVLMNNMRRAVTLCIVSFSLAVITDAHANLLINGSFEQGPNSNTNNIPPGSTAISGWIVTRAPIDGEVSTAGGWQAADGTHSLDLNGSPGVGGIAQTFGTVSGQQYQVTFSLAGNPTTARITSLGVEAAGQSAAFSFNTTGKTLFNMGWVTKSWTFAATDSVTTLEFFSTDTLDSNIGPALDNVSVAAVPEPGPITLVLSSLVVLGWFRKTAKTV